MDFVSSGSAQVTKAWLPILRLILYAIAPNTITKPMKPVIEMSWE